MNLVILGLSITSSWGNGHATTYRALVREFVARGHHVLFLEWDKPWYAEHRDLPNPPYGTTELYTSLEDLAARFTGAVCEADAVIVGSYVPEGIAVGEWVLQTAQGTTAFYDIDTPITLEAVEQGTCPYLSRALIPRYQRYFSFTGGPTLQQLERQYGSPRAVALYCSVDPTAYYPEPTRATWDMGYLGTYSDDRQPTLERLLITPARQLPAQRFTVAGPQYPAAIAWPPNVERREHLPPAEHRAWYAAQRYTLNVTRAAMIRAGYSPSVRLFEAAACGVPIISDRWDGLETLFLFGTEILVADSPAEVTAMLQDIPEAERQEMGERAQRRILAEHTAAHRAWELENALIDKKTALPAPQAAAGSLR